jgi:hypothetical protein
LKSQQSASGFVQGFFRWLEKAGIRACVLHGGEDGFEGDLSDIDFTIEPSGFERIVSLVDAYCASVGWRLCQILRHEPTAAFCVCSAQDDPACSVALDACSDYRREGVLLTDAARLLENRLPLPWGGYRLSEASELEYRILKAAAKKKDAALAEEEFLSHSAEVRTEVTARLRERWRISADEGQSHPMADLLDELRCRFKEKRSRLTAREIGRILSRIRHPAGMLVITGKEHHKEIADALSSVFSPLYFRDAESTAGWTPSLLPKLIRTRLLFIPSADTLWANLVPRDCRFVVSEGETVREAVLRFATSLEKRCKSREHLS